jgi:RNA polymerase sigma-70 factor (ECF subfamily)
VNVADTFDEIYKQHHSDVYRFILNLSGYNQILSEELTQETFFQAYRSIHKFKSQCHVRTWLFGIAKNVFFTYLRKGKNTINTDEVTLFANERFDVCDSLIQKELLDKAVNIIRSMQKNMADVMVFRIMGNIPYKQIARELGITESSAKVLYYRGKAILQEQLREVYNYEI